MEKVIHKLCQISAWILQTSLVSLLKRWHKQGWKGSEKSHKDCSLDDKLELSRETCQTNLTTLEERRVRGDLITFFKINNNLDIINWHNPPKTSAPRANKRGQLRRELVPNCLQRYNFLNNRVAAHWNKLPDHIIDSKTLNQFKNKLDQHYRDKNQQHITSWHGVSFSNDIPNGLSPFQLKQLLLLNPH